RVGQYYMSQLAGSYIPAVSSDEFRNLAQLDSRSLALAVSQSGETYDTLSSLRYAQEQGARTAAIVNVMGSSMARMVDHVILQGSGPEICVVSTKAAFAQMAILYLLALELALKQRRMRTGERDRLRDLLGELPQIVEATLNERSGFVHTIANRYQGVRSWLYLGRDIYYPTALEASLKMKEVTYLHAEGMSAGFLKHGTIAMIDKDINTVLLVPPPVDSEVYSLTISSAEEIKARDGLIIALRFEDDSPREGLFDEEVILPSVPPPIAPFLHLLAAQLLAYFTAVALRRDPDKPRSLAKSVTVE
ncbi:MAG: SIS domain-containing protein, partial [Nitrospinota bacterium]